MRGKLTLIKGDLWETDRQVVANECGTSGRFPAEVARRYPTARWMYLARRQTRGWEPGDVQLVMTDEPGRTVANVATRPKDLDSLREGFGRLLDLCERGGWGVATGPVGEGLPWAEVEAVLRDLLLTREVELDVHRGGPQARPGV